MQTPGLLILSCLVPIVLVACLPLHLRCWYALRQMMERTPELRPLVQEVDLLPGEGLVQMAKEFTPAGKIAYLRRHGGRFTLAVLLGALVFAVLTFMILRLWYTGAFDHAEKGGAM